MINKSKFQFVVVVCASLAFILFSAATSSGGDFIPYAMEGGWTFETFEENVPIFTLAIAFDDENNLYVTNYTVEKNGKTITVYKYNAPDYFSLDSSVYVSYQKTLDITSGIDFDGKGNLFVSEIVAENNPSGYDYVNAGLIRKISNGGHKISEPVIFIDIPNVPEDGDYGDFRPTGIAATGNETLYFPGRRWQNDSWGKIYKIDSFKKYDPVTGPSIVREYFPKYAIADDKWGQIFVADRNIYARNPYTDKVVNIALFDSPYFVEEMAFDSVGNLYALEGYTGTQLEIIKIIPPHIEISGCDTGIIDWPLGDGSTIGDVIEESCADISSPGHFVSCVISYAVDFMDAGLLSPEKVASIVTCASQASIP